MEMINITTDFANEKTTMENFNRRFNAPYGEPDAGLDGNTIASEHIRIGLDDRKIKMNPNVLVIGGTGTGKSRCIAYPNILQMNGSYVIADPHGELYQKTAAVLKENGYEVKVFNLTDATHSDHYNPFAYLHDEEDVEKLAKCLFANREKGENRDLFWEKAETALVKSVIFYLLRYRPKTQKNFPVMAKMLCGDDAQVIADCLDAIFDEVRKCNPDDICVKQYDIFKQSSEKTALSILTSTSSKLKAFCGKEKVSDETTLSDITSTDDLDLTSLGDRKTALFVISANENIESRFLSASLYSCAASELYRHAAENAGCRLKYHVTFILDAFPNMCTVPEMTKYMCCSRKYGISFMLLCQAIGQLKERYPDDAEIITASCDTIIAMGGDADISTSGFVTRRLSQSTILKDKEMQAGKECDAVELCSPLRTMEPDCCIVMVDESEIFYDKKYDPKEHPKFSKETL